MARCVTVGVSHCHDALLIEFHGDVFLEKSLYSKTRNLTFSSCESLSRFRSQFYRGHHLLLRLPIDFFNGLGERGIRFDVSEALAKHLIFQRDFCLHQANASNKHPNFVPGFHL